MERTLLIRGLPPSATVQSVTRFAETYGGLARVVVEHEGAARSSRAICWVTYQSDQDAERAQSLIGNPRFSISP